MKRAEEMRELFSRWKSSGQSLMAFGRTEGVPYSRLLYWRRKLGDGVSTRTASPVKSVTDGKLVPVRIVPDSNPVDAQAEAFEVWLPNGVSLNVTAGFDEAELRRLVGALSTC
jgi:hypothetical protein